MYPSFCSTRACAHTHEGTIHTRAHTRAREIKRGNSLFNEVDDTWHILTYFFTTHFPSLWQLPHSFHYQRCLLPEGCIWMKKDARTHTHTHTHTQMQKEREREESCFATRKRKVCVSLTALWCNTDKSMNTHTHTHTLSTSLIQSRMHVTSPGYILNCKNLSPGLRGIWMVGKMEHVSNNSFSLTHLLLFPVTHPLAQQICIDICQSNEMHGKSGSVAFGKWTPPEFPLRETPRLTSKKKKKEVSERPVQVFFKVLGRAHGIAFRARWLTLGCTCTRARRSQTNSKDKGAVSSSRTHPVSSQSKRSVSIISGNLTQISLGGTFPKWKLLSPSVCFACWSIVDRDLNDGCVLIDAWGGRGPRCPLRA